MNKKESSQAVKVILQSSIQMIRIFFLFFEMLIVILKIATTMLKNAFNNKV